MKSFWNLNKGKALKPKHSLWNAAIKNGAKWYYGDADGDKVMNGLDCQPYNKRKQGPQHEAVRRMRGPAKDVRLNVKLKPSEEMEKHTEASENVSNVAARMRHKEYDPAQQEEFWNKEAKTWKGTPNAAFAKRQARIFRREKEND